MTHLQRFTERAERLSLAELHWALSDVTKTLHAFRERPLSDPYIDKLYAEFDAYSVEIVKRRRAPTKHRYS
jgi:hypothetical protein